MEMKKKLQSNAETENFNKVIYAVSCIQNFMWIHFGKEQYNLYLMKFLFLNSFTNLGEYIYIYIPIYSFFPKLSRFLHSQPTQLCVHLFLLLKSICATPKILDVWFSHTQAWLTTRGNILRENGPLLSQHLAIANSYLAKGVFLESKW